MIGLFKSEDDGISRICILHLMSIEYHEIDCRRTTNWGSYLSGPPPTVTLNWAACANDTTPKAKNKLENIVIGEV
jgi:hypothetical protein